MCHRQLERSTIANHRRICHHGVMLRTGDDGYVDLVDRVAVSGGGDVSYTVYR